MNQTDSILMTGITGSLGSVLAGRILRSGHRIRAVVRGQNRVNALARTKQILDIIGASYSDQNLEVILGDVCEENLGISSKYLSGVSFIIHCAALLDFTDNSATRNHQVNVVGTANVLRLAESLYVPICHISTAYIAGKRQGTVREDELNMGQEYHNSYETSKYQAEEHLQNWSKTTGLPVMVFRPSILVGDSKTGRIVNFDGLYNLLRFFDNVADLIRNDEFRAVANPQATKNLIPVDIAAEMIWKIIQSRRPGVYHITNPEPISLARLREIFIKLFNIPQARFVEEEDFTRKKKSRYELMYQKASSFYLPYLRHEPVFDRTFTEKALGKNESDVPAMDLKYFQRLIAYAREVNWGKKQTKSAAESNGRYEYIVEDYFNRFLVSKMHKQLLPDLKKLSASCRICVSEVPLKSWSLQIDHGRLKKISLNGTVCQCTFLVDGDTFERIITGKLAPQQAFFRKKVDIKGNIEKGLTLATVLAAFFRKYPYQTGEYDG
ncbi:MAG: hydroxysteroid dehydrogenase-like protein 2 [Sedimentisphaerales bacterium]|nr:hydroxysteroid dehydrogenase-like protein 2 [Sedimentisphaerales bacterium]